jgi:hypothetical protein
MLYYYSIREYVNTTYLASNMPSECLYFYVKECEKQTSHRNNNKFHFNNVKYLTSSNLSTMADAHDTIEEELAESSTINCFSFNN